MLKFSGVSILLVSLILVTQHVKGQKYDYFEIENNDLFWRYTFDYAGAKDSLRREVVQMLKSKFFTFNVTRNEAGYTGEIRHYKVDCKKYGLSYLNTPRMYTKGEWTGKFPLEVTDNHYRVTIHALYYEKMQQSTDYYKTQETVKGRSIEAVTKKNKLLFKKNEYANLALMSLSLKDDFDIRNTLLFHEGS